MTKIYCSLIILDCPETVMLRPQRNRRRSILCNGISYLSCSSATFLFQSFSRADFSQLGISEFMAKHRLPWSGALVTNICNCRGFGGNPCCLGEGLAELCNPCLFISWADSLWLWLSSGTLSHYLLFVCLFFEMCCTFLG